MSFGTIRIALSGITAMQNALEVTGHNIVNVDTEGYHRQEAILQTTIPYPTVGNPGASVGGQFGTGVTVEQIRRLQDDFLEQQLRNTNGQYGRQSTLQDSLSQIESFISPGTSIDISSMLDKFFSAWDVLSSHPEEESSRLNVRSSAVNLVNILNDSSSKLDYMSSLTESNIQDTVDRINLLADNLASLNAQIGMAKEEGRSPNDLLDQRSSVLTELTSLTGASSLALNAESTSVTNIGSRPLVEGNSAFHIKFDYVTDSDGIARKHILWASDSQPADVLDGKLNAFFSIRDQVIPNYKSQLNTISSALITAVNAKHVTGYTMNGTTGQAFFGGTDAGSIHVDANILTDARNIAATTTNNAAGDGSLATEIFNLNQQALIGSQTLNLAAQSIIGQIGNAVKSSQTSLNAVQSLQSQLTEQQQRASGVSLDEELSNMLTYQRSYDSSARVLKAADEMIQSLLAIVQ
ncbi:MAG TPA: flagellar hook-associated protein FlgK [Armatimonadota bacterium]|nr:flagellar hook-associated protein FlgK [Armatimonadota bacterium]